MASSRLKPVCKDCFQSIDFDKLQSGEIPCTHGVGNKRLVTVATVPCGSMYINPEGVRLRPPLPPRYTGSYKLCRHHRSCRYGQVCKFAHSEQECIVWNRHSAERCSECIKQQLEELVDLQMKLCTSNHSQSSFHNGFLWTIAVSSQEVVQIFAQNGKVVRIFRPLPSNVDMMRRHNYKYKFKHTHYDCRFRTTFQGCFHPHNLEEDAQWNQWKEEGLTPVKLHDRAVAEYEKLRIKQETKPVMQVVQMKSQWQKSADSGKTAAYTVQSKVLETSNYKDWFHNLLNLEDKHASLQLTQTSVACASLDAVCDGRSEYHVEYKEGHFRYYFTVKMACDTAEFLNYNASSIEVDFIGPKASHALRIGRATVPRVTAVPRGDDDTGLILSTETPLNVGQYKLRFLYCRQKSMWGKFHSAVEDVPNNIILRLIPQFRDFAIEIDNTRDCVRYEERVKVEKILELDHIFQQEAAEAILNCPVGPPFLVTGPFGTGKTRLIARLTHQILHTEPGSRVLISVHHHQTADSYPWSFFSKLSRHFPLPCQVVRLVPDAKEGSTHDSYHNVITCTADQCSYYFPKHEEIRLVVTTNSTATRLMRDVKLPRGHFTHIFLDEAAQCTEPEALLPLLLAGPKTKIILAGDHLQVGPEDKIRSPEARKHGLNMSLLTRLHRHYAQISQKKGVKDSPLVRRFTANLLTNYRCDAGILRLPSNLFYECSLLARAQHELHPDTNSSLLFVCTSLRSDRLQWSDLEETREIKLMLQKAEGLCCNWPEAWNDFGVENSVCLMARTHQQLSKIRARVRERKDILTKVRSMLHSKSLQLRTTFSIQGQEYTVVFLCTTEPYTKAPNGQAAPKADAIGTSIVNRRVFNTVLTRARTLFVAIGNPFYLMQAEANASSELGAGLCWKEYLRKCIENDSIELPPDCSEHERQALLEKVFDDHDPLGRRSKESGAEQDSILDQYSWEFLRKLSFIGGSWNLPKLKPEDEEEDNAYSNTSEPSRVSNEWILECKSAHSAEAVPRTPGLPRYSIQGMKSRGRALNGAVVKVASSDRRSADSSSLRLGWVESVVKQSEQKLFLCRIDQFNSNLFVPLNGLGPKLANLPAVSRKLIQIDKAQDEIEERMKGYAAFKKYPVSCFDLSGLEKEVPVPKLRDVIPLESAKNLVFIVRYIQWNEENVYPMAAVVGTFPVAHTQFHAKRVLNALHQGREERAADIEAAMEGFSRLMLSDGSGTPSTPISNNPKEDARRLNLALQCSQSSKLYLEAKVSRTEGKQFFMDLPGKPCGPLESSQPAFRIGCEKAGTEGMTVNWRFKICSTRKPEEVLRNLSQLRFEGRAVPVADDKVYLSLVVTDKESEKTTVVKGWTAATLPTPVPQVPQAQGVLSSSLGAVATLLQSINPYGSSRSEQLPLEAQSATFPGKLKGAEISLYSFTIKCSVAVGQVLPVWIAANTSGLVIQPEVQVVKPAPYLDICMQHSTRAAQCFSSPVLQNASLERYRDIDEYVTLWESALMAEAAESSVKDGELLFIDYTFLNWPREGFKRVTNLLKPNSYVFVGNVTLELNEDFIDRCGRFVSLSPGDFVCARYEVYPPYSRNPPDPLEAVRGLYHFVVQSCKEEQLPGSLQTDLGKPAKQILELKMIGERNSMVSESMYQRLTIPGRPPPCTLQVIQCMVPQRRMYESLLKLRDSGSSFVTNVVACGHVNLTQPVNLDAHPHETPSDFLSRDTDFTRLWSGGSQSLNTKQVEAMKKALQYKFTLIQGPPGTGKSVTGAHLAYAFAKFNQRFQLALKGPAAHRCVLYCAPSNKAVDVVLDVFAAILSNELATKDTDVTKEEQLCYLHELVHSKGSANVSILRIYSRAIEYETAGGGPRQNEEVFKQIIVEKPPDKFEVYSLNKKVKDTSLGPEISALEKKFERLKAVGSIPTRDDEKRYHRLLSAAERVVFGTNRFNIVLCTCNEAASNRVSKHVLPRQCIIDECGFAIEPDVMIPLQHCQHVVLIGDHKQLQPVIKNSAAGENGLRRSLFERYADMYTKVREKQRKRGEETRQERHAYTQLQEQYRMRKGICDPPSKTFYDGTLTPAASVETSSYRSFLYRVNVPRFTEFWPSPDKPIMVCNVVGSECSPSSALSRSGGPESKQNPEEARKVASTAQCLVEDCKLTQDDIVVLTPYRGQKDCITYELQRRGLLHLAVKTVNESQGSEANVIILSTVRSMPTSDFEPDQLRGDRSWSMEHLGFVTDPHQICVGITRSKFGLIIVGNTRLLSCDPTWHKLLQQFRSHQY